MNRLIQYFRRNVRVGIGIIALLLLLAFINIEMNIDLGMVLFGLGFISLIGVITMIVKHLTKPEKSVRLITKVVIESPPRLLKAIKNHKIHIQCEKHLEHKGKSEIVKMDEFIIIFNERDHPNLLAESRDMVRDYLSNQEQLLKVQHPGYKLHVSPFAIEKTGPLSIQN